jgi:dTDP-4-amino-4,6-dideoxygalactose transaminase
MGTTRWPAWPETDLRSYDAVSAVFDDPAGAGAASIAVAAKALAASTGRAHCVLTENGTTATLIALRRLGAGPGEVVLLPATASESTVDSVFRTGAEPAFYDVSESSLSGFGRMPDVQPKVVFAKHVFAQRADIRELRARFPAARIVDDAPYGGDVTVLDLGARNLVTAGEGGAVLTDDPSLAAEPDGGQALSEMAAALLVDQLDRLPGQSARRVRGARRLLDRLDGSRWHCVYDEDALNRGDFTGIALRLPHGRGPRERVIADVHEAAGLILGEIPPLPQAMTHRPIGTFKEHSLNATLARNHLSLRWWRHNHLIVPHHVFLAGDDLLDALADALVTDTPSPYRIVKPRPSIDVVMVTQGWRPTLPAALASVAAQEVDADIRVTLFLDSPTGTIDLPGIDGIRVLGPGPGDVLPEAPWDRIAELRQLAARTCDADYTAFIDDDNLWTTDHLSSLLAKVRQGAAAAHSWRELILPDGTAAAQSRFPWLPAGAEADDVWHKMVTSGSMTPGESIVREGSDIGMVDMGEWLFATWLLRLLKFCRPRTAEELDSRMGEDDILLNQLCRFQVPLACTERASLRYRLGGMSNPETPRPAELSGDRR